MTNLTTSTNMLDNVTGLTDHAAAQSDRWLFIAALLIGIACLGVLWRWFTSDRAAINARLTEITDRHIKTTENLGQVVANNTEALRRVEVAITGCHAVQMLRTRQDVPSYQHPFPQSPNPQP